MTFRPLLLLALAVAGCGSDSGSGGDTGNAGKKLSDLTVEENQQLCRSNFDDFQAISAGSCTLGGLGAPTKTECETARDECNQGTMKTTAMAACDPSNASDLSDCTTVRVGQLSSCLVEVRAYFAMLSCDTAGTEPPMAPSCLATIEQGCPALVSGGS